MEREKFLGLELGTSEGEGEMGKRVHYLNPNLIEKLYIVNGSK